MSPSVEDGAGVDEITGGGADGGGRGRGTLWVPGGGPDLCVGSPLGELAVAGIAADAVGGAADAAVTGSSFVLTTFGGIELDVVAVAEEAEGPGRCDTA